jgi:galactonate dehydratase
VKIQEGYCRNFQEEVAVKIEDIRLIPAGKYLFVKIMTDAGISGIGEIGVWGYLDAAGAVVEKLKKSLIGQEAGRIEHLWQYFYRSLYFRGAVIMSALSAIDLALWDIKGKALGVPVYELLGGKCRDRVRSYAPVFRYTAEEMANECVRLQKSGFTAARLIIPNLSGPDVLDEPVVFSEKIQRDIEKIKSCREAVGGKFDLCIEIHRSMSPAEAIAFARGVEAYLPYFIEDPIPPDNPQAMAQVATSTSVPITTGERAITIQEMEQLMRLGAARYVRPDVCALGGLSPAKKVAALAEAHYVGIIPHNPLGPISTAGCLQLDACIPNFALQEFPSFNMGGEEDSMIKEPLRVEQGHLLIPQGPGLGVELVDDIEERFPPTPRNLSAIIAFDGSVIDR